MNQNSTGTQLLTLAIKVPHRLGTLQHLHGGIARSTLKLALAKPGVLGSFCRKLRAVSDETEQLLAQVSLVSEGLEPDATSRVDAAVDRPHNSAKGF